MVFLFNFLLFPIFVQIEIKMKKTEAIHWEKLEGEGSLSTVKHFTPSQSQKTYFACTFRQFSLSSCQSVWLADFHFISWFSIYIFRPVPVVLPLHTQLGQGGGWNKRGGKEREPGGGCCTKQTVSSNLLRWLRWGQTCNEQVFCKYFSLER